MNQIIIQSEYELKQLSKAFQELSKKNIKFFITPNLEVYVSKHHQELKHLVQNELIKNESENSINQQEFDIKKLKQLNLVVKKKPYYFYQENSPRSNFGITNLNSQENEQSQDINEQNSLIREPLEPIEQIQFGVRKKCKIWLIRKIKSIHEMFISNSIINKAILIVVVLWHLIFFILQLIIWILTKNKITKISSAFVISNILIRYFQFFFFFKNHQSLNFSLVENLKLSLFFLIQRIFGLWHYANRQSHRFQMKRVLYNLQAFQNFQKYAIKYQQILALSKLKNEKLAIPNKTPFIYQTLWRDYVFLGICKIIIIYGNLFIINEEFPIFLPILLTYQIFEEILSNYYLITEAVVQNVIPALILSQKTFNHFLESMMIFIDFSSKIQIENPQFIRKLNQLNDHIFQQYPIEINVSNITDINEQILKTFTKLKIVELKQAESFLYLINDQDFRLQLQQSEIFELKLSFHQMTLTNEQLNHILLQCPKKLQFLHISIEHTFSANDLDLKLNHLQNLQAFKFTFIQNLNQKKKSNIQFPQIAVNESFLNLDKVNFKILNLELNGCLTLTSFKLFFNQFNRYEELYLKLVVQDNDDDKQQKISLDKLNFSQHLHSLTLFCKKLSLKFGENFGKKFENLKYFKFIPIECCFKMEKLIMAIQKMNQKSHIIFDFSHQKLDESDLKQITDLKIKVSQKI